MKSNAVVCFACIALFAMPARAFCNVFGGDDRQPMLGRPDSRRYPWSCVGRVQTGPRGFGTSFGSGALVGPNLVLTAAHVVVDGKGNLLSDIAFVPNMVGGDGFRSFVDFVWLGTANPKEDRENDWALLRLANNPGYQKGWMACDVELPEKATLVGYSGDGPYVGHTAMRHVGCAFHGREGDLILHDGDSTRGASGAPMFVMIDGRPVIVALHVAERRKGGEHSLRVTYYTDEYANVAIPASKWISTLEKIFPAEEEPSFVGSGWQRRGIRVVLANEGADRLLLAPKAKPPIETQVQRSTPPADSPTPAETTTDLFHSNPAVPLPRDRRVKDGAALIAAVHPPVRKAIKFFGDEQP